MKTILLSLALICLSGLLFSAERQYGVRPASESYMEESTGISFPALLGNFRKKEVIVNYNILVGTQIRYEDNSGAAADISVYALSTEEKTVTASEAEQQFELCRKAILKLPSAGGIVSEVSEKGRAYEKGVSRANFEIVASEMPMDSVLLLFPFKTRIIKIRISVPQEMKDNTDLKGFLQDLFKQIRPS